jgi:signal transduction histidine kinase
VAGVESASRITEAVLGFARTDDEAERADVAEVVESSLACLGRDPTRDGINVVLQVEKGLEVRIRPLGLQQVLLNLVLNAVRALNGKGGELRITARDQNGTTTIAVADTGPGIPPSIADTIFEPFVSSHDRKCVESSQGHGGSGLGLAVCRRLIERSGGTIVLDRSDEPSQQGARFQITLLTCLPEADEPKKAA